MLQDWTEAELQELSRARTNQDEATGLFNELGPRPRPTMTSRQLDRGIYNDEEEMVSPGMGVGPLTPFQVVMC